MFYENDSNLNKMEDGGYSIMSSCYSFVSPIQIVILFAGFDTHICLDFILEICRPALLNLFASIYQKIFSDPSFWSFNQCYEWLVKDHNDSHFGHYRDILTGLINALALFICGTKEGNYDRLSVGEKYLVPIVGILGKDYFKSIVRCIYELNYRVQPRNDTFVFARREWPLEGVSRF